MAQTIKLIFLATGNGIEFTACATSRAMELCIEHVILSLLGRPVADILRFIHFDCLTNGINVFDFPLATAASVPNRIGWRELSQFVPSGPPSFAPASFLDTGGGQTLGITQLYHSIRGAPRQSVLELSIYSHGTPDGPIVQYHDPNSSDDNPPSFPTPAIRNRTDKNGRVRTDFEDNMGEDPADATPRTGGQGALIEFKERFDPNAEFRISGCEALIFVRGAKNLVTARLRSTAIMVIKEAYIKPVRAHHNLLGKPPLTPVEIRGEGLAIGTIPSVPIDIDMGSQFREEQGDAAGQGYTVFDATDRVKDRELRRIEHYKLDPQFFNTNSLILKNKTYQSVIGFVARRLQEMYAFKAASKLGIKVIAGPVGLKSSLLKAGQVGVCGDFKVSDCTYGLGFYRDFMQLTQTFDNRNYSIFDQAAVTNINTLATQI